jgi:hypothetical protein
MAKTLEQDLAHRAVSRALATGALAPLAGLTCRACGRTAQAYHHHAGYAAGAWLDVVALCDHCHAQTHRAALVANVTRARRAWQEQRAAVAGRKPGLPGEACSDGP